MFSWVRNLLWKLVVVFELFGGLVVFELVFTFELFRMWTVRLAFDFPDRLGHHCFRLQRRGRLRTVRPALNLVIIELAFRLRTLRRCGHLWTVRPAFDFLDRLGHHWTRFHLRTLRRRGRLWIVWLAFDLVVIELAFSSNSSKAWLSLNCSTGLWLSGPTWSSLNLLSFSNSSKAWSSLNCSTGSTGSTWIFLVFQLFYSLYKVVPKNKK